MHSKTILIATVLLASLPAFSHSFAQYSDRRNGGQYQDNRDNRGYRHDRPNFNNGLRDGGRGGEYYEPRHERDGYDERYRQNYGYYQQRQGGIGPGKGALIGGAGGAVLGTLFGGGLKGTIIGGAAGAGIGAVVGQANQNNRRRDEYYPR
jgi:hypothetical protein